MSAVLEDELQPAVGEDRERVRDVVVGAVAEGAAGDQSLLDAGAGEPDADLDGEVAGETERGLVPGVEITAVAELEAVVLLERGRK